MRPEFSYGYFSLAIALMLVACLFKTSFLIGSHNLHLSGFSIIIPVLGMFVSSLSVVGLVGIRLGIKGFVSGVLYIPKVFYIPTLGATWYLTTHQVWLKILLPISCMILFGIHPVGAQCLVYTAFWIIPVIGSFSSSLFLSMLASTFVAHAIGSVCWLYTMPMSPEQFIALIPVVIVERLLMASLMTALYLLLKKVGMVSNSFTIPFARFKQV